MGQYYLLVNRNREEYISPHDLGCGAKLWEICANDMPRVLPYLLQQSDELGGGDPRNQATENLGRWAGDELVVIGDYDDSDLYVEAEDSFEEISDEIRSELNAFLPVQQKLDESIYGRHGLDELLFE